MSGGGWGVGDLLGATEAALQVPDALVLCLCGRNDRLRARIVGRFPDEPRLRVMGFTDRMGDVLAASDALVHSSGGLTILEAIIRGCPVISYGFSYGHVRATDKALERFELAQVAHKQADIEPALERALAQRPEPDTSFARQPSTASMILVDERRVRQLPAWRLRAVRAFASSAALVALAGWTLTTGASYKLVSHFAHIRPVTAVATTRPEVGVLIDAPASQVPGLAGALSRQGVHVSFGVDRAAEAESLASLDYGDQVLPRLPDGGLVRWIGARKALHRLLHQMGFGRHFLYASHGPSVGQWLIAHGAGGRLVAGAVTVDDPGDSLGSLRPGEVIELGTTAPNLLQRELGQLRSHLRTEHLTAVPVGRLLTDAHASA